MCLSGSIPDATDTIKTTIESNHRQSWSDSDAPPLLNPTQGLVWTDWHKQEPQPFGSCQGTDWLLDLIFAVYLIFEISVFVWFKSHCCHFKLVLYLVVNCQKFNQCDWEINHGQCRYCSIVVTDELTITQKQPVMVKSNSKSHYSKLFTL